MTQPYSTSLPAPVATSADREDDPRRAVGLVALVAAAVTAVLIFLPPEGRIAGPLHDGVWALVGQASFMVPLGLLFVGLVLIVSTLRPNVALPRRRLIGASLIAVGVPPSEQLLGAPGAGTGLVGRWLSSTLLDLLGGPGTVVVLLLVLGLGLWLAFDLKLHRAKVPDAAG